MSPKNLVFAHHLGIINCVIQYLILYYFVLYFKSVISAEKERGGLFALQSFSVQQKKMKIGQIYLWCQRFFGFFGLLDLFYKCPLYFGLKIHPQFFFLFLGYFDSVLSQWKILWDVRLEAKSIQFHLTYYEICELLLW